MERKMYLIKNKNKLELVDELDCLDDIIENKDCSIFLCLEINKSNLISIENQVTDVIKKKTNLNKDIKKVSLSQYIKEITDNSQSRKNKNGGIYG